MKKFTQKTDDDYVHTHGATKGDKQRCHCHDPGQTWSDPDPESSGCKSELAISPNFLFGHSCRNVMHVMSDPGPSLTLDFATPGQHDFG